MNKIKKYLYCKIIYNNKKNKWKNNLNRKLINLKNSYKLGRKNRLIFRRLINFERNLNLIVRYLFYF